MSKEGIIHDTIWYRRWNVLYRWTAEMKEKETKNEYEYKHLRICRHGIQRESCRKCLFEVLCHLEEQQWKVTHDVDQTL